MIIALAAVLLPALAYAASPALPLPGYAPASDHAAPPPPTLTNVPLPGYSSLSGGFPPNAKLLGEVEDPLEALAAEEDLRDAVMSPPSPAWLMGKLRSPNPADRIAAVHSAAVPRHVSAVPALAALMLRLNEPAAVRAAAATALGRIGDAVAAPSLGEALNDPVPDVRYAAALALGRLPADGAATRLSRALNSDPSWWVRYAAVLALGRTRKGFVVGALENCLRVEPKWQIRMSAVRSLQDVGGARAVSAIGAALSDKDSGVRTAAAAALGEIGGEGHLPALTAALESETDPSARAELSAAYRRIVSKP